MASQDEAVAADPFGLCGTTIEGKYRVESVVGDGGFGVVYRGEHAGFGEAIAVKCLKIPSVLSEKQRSELLDQLKEEGRLLHRLSKVSAGIVQALDVGALTTGGSWVPYLVLEWLEGETLHDFLRERRRRGEGGMRPEEAHALLEPAARALAVAHAHKVAHRDVKPANLFVTELSGTRTLKVLDFGIAKVLGEQASMTQALAATVVGPSAFTPRYGAPEQFNKQRGASGPWTDVFALALLFVELVVGRPALSGDDPTQLYIASADPNRRPTLRALGIPDEAAPLALERVLARALAVEPRLRYPSAGAFWDALTAALRGEDVEGQRLEAAGAAARPASDAMTTADYAAAHELPLEASAAAPRRAVIVDPGAAVAGPTLPGTTAGRAAAVDPLGETPLPGGDPLSALPPVVPAWPPPSRPPPGLSSRATSPSPGAPPGPSRPAPGLARPPATSMHRAPHAPSAEASGSPEASERPGRSPWPYVVLGLVAAGAAAAYYAFDASARPSRPPRTASRPPVTAPATAPVAPKTAPELDAGITPTVAATASTSAAPAFVPPEDMALIPAGTYRMRGHGGDRTFSLSRPFYLDKREVTVRAYRACLETRRCDAALKVNLGPAALPPSVIGQGPSDELPVLDPSAYAAAWSRRCNEPRGALDHPINCVTHASAEKYCRFKGRRLPTEAEWEAAARGASGRAYAWGDDAPGCDRACFDRNGACLVPGSDVATCASGASRFDLTPEGVVDMAGNVAEWTASGWSEAPPSGADPNASGSDKVVRGGSFLEMDENTRAAHRARFPASSAHVSIGFRCALDAPP